MVRALIIETTTDCISPTSAHHRNTLLLQEKLRDHGITVDVLFSGNQTQVYRSDAFQRKYDVIMISYSSPYHRIHGLQQLLELNKETPWGWITNEYNLVPHNTHRDIFKTHSSFVIAGYEKDAVNHKCFRRQYNLNINCLLYQKFTAYPKELDYIYYGSWRPDRESSFRKYLQAGVYLSTSSKNHKKYRDIGCNARPLDRFGWRTPALLRFRYSLYIEDDFSHSKFTNLANRFYESIGCGCVLLFDQACKLTLERSGLKGWEEFIVKDYDDMQRFTASDYALHREKQAVWEDDIKQQQSDMIAQFAEILRTEAACGIIATEGAVA